MELTTEVKNNFLRFGCAVDYEGNCFYVDLPGVEETTLKTATIVFRAAYTRSKIPLLCLMFEISPTRILPRYSYYPFDLSNSSEVDFLSAIAEAATINFVFISSDVSVAREYRLKSWQRRQIKQMCEVGVNTIRILPAYDFGSAVRDFEFTTRIPQMFERVASDDDLSKIVESARTESEQVAPEKRALAQQVCRSFAQIIKARSAYLSDEQVKQLFTLRAALMFFVEFYREFDNYDDFADFFANAIAAKTKDETALRNALEWPPQLDAAIKWIDRVVAAFEVNQDGVRNNFFDNLSRTLGDVARGRELTLPMLQGVFEPLQPFLSSRPGRPSKDYSREFEWKASMSWTEVARKSLKENPEIREEFAGREFGSLDFAQQDSLKGRIREGVRNWALRNGKPMPAIPDKNPD